MGGECDKGVHGFKIECCDGVCVLPSRYPIPCNGMQTSLSVCINSGRSGKFEGSDLGLHVISLRWEVMIDGVGLDESGRNWDRDARAFDAKKGGNCMTADLPPRDQRHGDHQAVEKCSWRLLAHLGCMPRFNSVPAPDATQRISISHGSFQGSGMSAEIEHER
ncbi:uncharacterized protein EI90DRAFT_3019113 [Cantharellus anzutake]|uniref:uncharacterized protein n=1 Tax=Cantharellus anzutake TaxID=1750568 RepID=UPI001903C69F|nr:uncharacterized protein EI90DRAFT_3019113 [Cantharellus anzutake]KAF8325315.1 hypothetical protein EI90DRAFT_3019113 [Cantharellus anzutake]